jgi:2-haloacid dehalogenase
MASIQALTFDTGGTILDWYTGISTKLSELGEKRNIDKDWAGITHQYRIKSLMSMTGGDEDYRPDFNIDDVHRREIEEVFAENTITGFTPEDFEEVRLTWHELQCWPDVPTGLARLRSKYIVAQAAHWLQLEPSECLMVAAHGLDLAAAARTGFKTAFVRRPTEWGPLGEPELMKSEMKFDYVAEDFHDLADQLGCNPLGN